MRRARRGGSAAEEGERRQDYAAVRLGAATVLSAMRSSLVGNAKFIFQPAEESLVDSGAVQIVKAVVLKNPEVDAIFMPHLFPFAPSGLIQIGDGPVCAGAGKVTITVQGESGHGSQPHKAAAALPTAVMGSAGSLSTFGSQLAGLVTPLALVSLVRFAPARVMASLSF